MLIELAHYTMIFALTAVGLQTFLLLPTLWSSGSAVAIKLGFRGACFTSALLLFSFFILLYSFAVHDFSLAVVFETFDSQSSVFYALQAFCSSREGFLFTFIIVLSVCFLIGFSKKDLLTYQERGRYLFASGFVLFALLVLMLTTADPFVRIEEPPFEGVGFNPQWRPPHKTLEILFAFMAYAALTVTFIKMICMYSKGRQFVVPALQTALFALGCLICVLGSKVLTGFTVAENAALWQWTPDHSLLTAVFILTLGEVLLLFFCLYSKVFTNWIIVFAVLGLAFFSAEFFAAEYRLFALSADEVYFPNPVTALTAFAALTCFFLFLCSVMIKQTLPENSFFIFAKESFIGLAAATLLAVGLSVGGLSLLPTLFMFLPDLPLRLLPALLKNVLSGGAVAFTIFFFIAFKRKSLTKGWVKTDWKTDLTFWIGALILISCFLLKINNGMKIVLCFLPALLFFNAFLTTKSLNIPTSIPDLLKLFKTIKAMTYGLFLCGLGFLIFCVALAYCFFNRQTSSFETDFIKNKPEISLPCKVETLSGHNPVEMSQYRLLCSDTNVFLLSGKTVFQWQEKKLNVKLLKINTFSVKLIEIIQNKKNTLTIQSFDFPFLKSVGTGLFLMSIGILFLIFSVKRDQTA